MVLVAPESEVQVSRLSKLVLWESIAAVVALVTNPDLFTLFPFQCFGQLAALCS